MNHHHFQQQIRHVPLLDADNWLLVVDGYVSEPMTLKYTMFDTLSTTTIRAAMVCSGHTPENPMLAEATWAGVPLASILRDVRPEPRALYANFHSADGYTTSLPLDALQDGLLAHHMDGKPLPPEHGFPVRLVVPGLAGYKMPKWITHIVVSDQPRTGFWERRGAALDGVPVPVATLDVPKSTKPYGEPVALGGAAYGGGQAIQAVRVRVDGGPAQTIAYEGGGAGRVGRWQTAWQPAAPGRYHIEVEVIAEDGRTGSTAAVVEVQA